MGIMDSCYPNKQLFDPIRKKGIKFGKEEEVRQTLLIKMVRDLGYPKDLIAIEKELKELPGPLALSAPKRRIDLVCFTKKGDSLVPLLLIECKRELFGKEPLAQVMGYNAYIKAPFIAVVGRKENAIQCLLGAWDASHKRYLFLSKMPSYQELLDPQFIQGFA